jgi:hypothetical protein
VEYSAKLLPSVPWRIDIPDAQYLQVLLADVGTQPLRPAKQIEEIKARQVEAIASGFTIDSC